MNTQEVRGLTRGIALTAVTPFKHNGSLDEEAVVRLVEFLFEKGISRDNGFLLPLSTTGTFVAMTTEEKKKLIDLYASRCADRIPIVIGCNSVNQADSIELARYSQDRGAVGVMVCPPFYWAATEDQIARYFDAVCGSVDIGVFVYNNHWASQVDISLQCLQRILQNENVAGLKESTYSITKLVHVVRATSSRINILNGLGEAYEPLYSRLGTAGFTSTLGNALPEYSVELQRRLSQREYEDAEKVAVEVSALGDFLDSLRGGQYIAALMYLLGKRGVCEYSVRPPVLPLSHEDIRTLETLFESLPLTRG